VVVVKTKASVVLNTNVKANDERWKAGMDWREECLLYLGVFVVYMAKLKS
jgi:hypothetical protein